MLVRPVPQQPWRPPYVMAVLPQWWRVEPHLRLPELWMGTLDEALDNEQAPQPSRLFRQTAMLRDLIWLPEVTTPEWTVELDTTRKRR